MGRVEGGGACDPCNFSWTVYTVKYHPSRNFGKEVEVMSLSSGESSASYKYMKNICISLSAKAIGKRLEKETKCLKEERLSKGARLR